MRMIFSALTLALAFTAVTTAHAADKKLGNVIAVERTIDDVYQTCIGNMKQTQDESTFQVCSISAKKTNADFLNAYQRLLSFSKEGCEVEGSAQGNVVMFTFQANGPKATKDDAKTCLRKALDANTTKDSVTFLVYTVE